MITFDKNFIDELEKKIPENILELNFYSINNKTGYIRFDDGILKYIYINAVMDDITKCEKFNYKYLYKGGERGAMLRFEYIDNNLVFSKIYFTSKIYGENDYWYEYAYDSNLLLNSKYVNHPKQSHIGRIDGYQPDEILMTSKIEEYIDGETIKIDEDYFIYFTPKHFSGFNEILMEKKIVTNLELNSKFVYFTRRRQKENNIKNSIYLILGLGEN